MARPKLIGIYCIRREDKFYVGQSIDILKRLYEHQRKLNNKAHSNCKLQNTLNKYQANDIDVFEFEIIELCKAEELTEKEQHWIDTLDAVKNGYNICPVAESMRGAPRPPVSDETRLKLSIAQTGRRQSDSAKQKLSDFHIGKPKSKESIAKRKETMNGNYLGEDNWNYGKHHPQEVKDKIRASKNLNRIQCANCGAKLSITVAREIRKEKELGAKTKDLAAKYGVNRNTIIRVISQKTWKDDWWPDEIMDDQDDKISEYIKLKE